MCLVCSGSSKEVREAMAYEKESGYVRGKVRQIIWARVPQGLEGHEEGCEYLF